MCASCTRHHSQPASSGDLLGLSAQRRCISGPPGQYPRLTASAHTPKQITWQMDIVYPHVRGWGAPLLEACHQDASDQELEVEPPPAQLSVPHHYHTQPDVHYLSGEYPVS